MPARVLRVGAYLTRDCHFATRGTIDHRFVRQRIGELLRSEAIVIASDSYAPVFLSRRETTVISDDIRNYSSINKFDEKYVFPRKNAGSID